MNSTDDPIEYSSRLGPISTEQFQAALDRFGLGEFVSAEPVTDGLFGQNVFVTSTSGEYVLRGCPHSDIQFPREQFHAQMLHERTVAPVPWPYLLEENDEIFGWSYIIKQIIGKTIVGQHYPFRKAGSARGVHQNGGIGIINLGHHFICWRG